MGSDTTYSAGLYTLDNIVEEFLLLSERPESDYRKGLQLAIRAYRELRLHTVKEGTKVTKETVSSINRVDFPSDFMDFVNIGVVYGGKVWLLTPNDEFILTTTDVGALETQDEDAGEGETIPNESISGYFARGGSNTKGYYQIEWDKRRIALINVTETTVLLSYKTSGASLDGTTYVPIKYITALQAFMAWWDVALKPGTPVSQSQQLETTWLKLRNQLAEGEYSLEEWEWAIYSTMYPLAKR